MLALGVQCAIDTSAAGNWFSGPAFTAADISDGVTRTPAFIADFRRDRHALTSAATANIASASVEALLQLQSVSFAEMFVFTRTSAGEYIDAFGSVIQEAADKPRFDYRNGYRQLLLEGPATNLFVNAFAPASQTIVVVSGTQYTISCRGSGSVAVSGAASGTVTQTAPLTFSASTTGLTLTVSGVLSRAQVETGAVATSFIQTAGGAATRSADSCRLSPSAEVLLQRNAATLLIRGQGVSGSLGRLVGAGSGDEIIRLNTAQTSVVGGMSLPIAGVTTPLPVFGLCFGWNASGRSGCYNLGSVTTDAVVPSITGQIYLGRNQTGVFAAGRYDSLTIWPFRATNAAIQSRSSAYS